MSGAALAADLPSRTAPQGFVVAPVFTWTGFYLGANLGYGGGRFEYPFAIELGYPVTGSARLDSNGILGGAQVGYNWQFGNGFVLGVEADYAFADIKGQVNVYATDGVTTLSAEAGGKLTGLGTVRARLGYAYDRTLFYATGGWAYGRAKSQLNAGANGLGFANASKTVDQNGWALGAGIEYAFTNSVSFKTEYLYVDLGNDTLYADKFSRLDLDTRLNIVRAGVNYRF